MLGTINLADLMTTYLSADVNDGHCTKLSLHFASGRAGSAPTRSSIMDGKATCEMDGAIANDGAQGDDEYEGMEATPQEAVAN